jgi:Spherulation-specific family 4
MKFLVIINPDDGPGNDTLSDPNFQRELPKLFNRQNVVPIGYVRTINATRSIKDVEGDVDKYSEWIMNSTSSYLMHGIFFDETPSIYTSEGAEFMSQIDDYVKHHDGFNQSLVYASLDFLT